MTISPRQLEEQVAHKLRYTFSYNVPGNATMNPAAGGVNFGAIPNGAVITSCDVFVTDSFNSGTSCALNVGFSGNGTDLVSAGNLAATAALTTTATPIAASKTTLQATAKTGTQVFATLNAAGTLATSGNCTVVVNYTPDWTGIGAGGAYGVAGG